MTKFELEVAIDSLECKSCNSKTAAILGLENAKPLREVLADENELATFRSLLQELLTEREEKGDEASPFRTTDLVLLALEPSTQASKADRSPLKGMAFASLTSIHVAGELHFCCFAHLELSGETVLLSAVEYSRSHRKKLLRQEFGSWLLEDHIEKAVIATTLTGEVVFWNRFATELYQYTSQEVQGRNIMELTPTDMTQDQAVEIMAKLGAGQHWKGMFQVQRKDKSTFIAHVTNTPVQGADGGIEFIVGVSADYSQLHNVMKQLEDLNANLEQQVQERTHELLEKEKYLRMVGAAVRVSDTGVLITNDRHRVVWSNNAVSRMLHRTEAEILGSFPWELPLQIERSSPDDGSLRGFFTSPDSTPAMTVTVEGSEKILQVSVQRLPAEEFMISFRDVTAERKATQAETSSRAKTEMVRILSHELRTPLQGIMGSASMLLADLQPECDVSMHDSLSVILASSRLLLTLINNILDLGKLEANRMMEEELSSIPVAAVVKDSLQFCEPFAALNEVDLIFRDRDRDLGRVVANRIRLEQILVNLTSNAVKYTAPNTNVEISCRRCSFQQAFLEAKQSAASDLHLCSPEELQTLGRGTGDVLVISVRDYGPGVSENELDKVFGEYQQLSVSAQKDRSYSGGKGGQSIGSGLGLNLTLKFVTRMKGHIWFQNCETGPGAVFSIFIPCTADLTDSHHSIGTPVPEVLELRPEDSAFFRVLVVDDNIINLKVLVRMLKRIGVSQVDTALNGAEALERLMESDKKLPNLILSDLQMPIMDGYQLMDKLRCTDLPARPFAAAISADWSSETEEQCFDVGFDEILHKPISFSDLKTFLARIMAEEPERYDDEAFHRQ